MLARTLLTTLLLTTAGVAQPVKPTTAFAHTPEVDIAYWVYGAPSPATPVIVINGGPGLSHIYMLQNDTWPRLAKGRQVIVYDQRGLGRSTRVSPGAPQTMQAQIAARCLEDRSRHPWGAARLLRAQRSPPSLRGAGPLRLRRR